MRNQRDEVGLPDGIRQHLGLQLALFYAEGISAGADQPFEAVLARLDRALQLHADADAHAFRQDLVVLRPKLVAWAMSLVRNAAAAEDLAQETLLRAWRSRHQFTAGTNLEAWLFTILRNQHRSQFRNHQHEVEDVENRHALTLATLPNQELRLTLQDLDRALDELPTKMREAFVRVALEGMSYDEAAAQLGCREGTVKSRVSRARARLEAALDGWLDTRDCEAST
ncbi:sigma-70 family RNA polymerase sigma factor [Methylobacterium komagatae]